MGNRMHASAVMIASIFCAGSVHAANITAEGALTLEVDGPCQGDAGDVLYVQLWMRDVASFATGFYAEVNYDTARLVYNAASTSYSTTPFPAHLTPLSAAEGPAGQLQFDGSTFAVPPDPPATGDALLATICFDVLGECDTTQVVFDPAPNFISELSFEGVGLITSLIDSPVMTLDGTPPVVTNCPPNITTGGPPCDQLIIWNNPVVSDNCDPAPTIDYDIDLNNDGSIDASVPGPVFVFPVGTHRVVTRVTDACGNINAVCRFIVNNTGTCPEDCAVPCNGFVDTVDLLALLAEWGMSGTPCDINNDGTVDVVDLLALLAAWGPCP